MIKFGTNDYLLGIWVYKKCFKSDFKYIINTLKDLNNEIQVYLYYTVSACKNGL